MSTYKEPMLVEGDAAVHDVTLVVDTAAYVSGDLLSDAVEIPNFFRSSDKVRRLDSIVVIDEADQKSALALIFIAANRDFGTINSAPTLTDEHARDVVGKVSIAASDYVDLGGAAVATVANVGVTVKASSSRSLWVAAICLGTPTYAAAANLKLKIGVL